MANGNPFYIEPGTDYSQGLQGLASSMMQIGEMKEEQSIREEAKARLEKMRQDAMSAFESGDPEKMYAFSVAHPEFAQAMTQAINFKNEKTKDNYFQSAMSVLVNPSPENIRSVVQARQQFLKDQGSEDTALTDSFQEKMQRDPEGTIKSLSMEIPALFPKRFKEYQSAIQGNYKDRYKVVGDRLVDVAAPGKPKVVIDDVQNKPMSAIGKLKNDFANGIISEVDYKDARAKLINPSGKSKADLTALVLKGDEEAKNILAAMADAEIAAARAKGEASTAGKIEGLKGVMDIEGTAKAVLEGRETIENVKNTFGVPIQETVRQKVLEQEPDFNFVQPRAIVKSLNSSLMQQQKNRGMMGSFVKNINDQVDRLSQIGNDIIGRVGVRALDLPIRELKTRFVGSGNERVFEAYMKEISAEIAKLSQGSAASIAQLPEENRKEWERIHDPNLSMRELITILNGTKEMANIRLQSVQSEIDYTVDKLSDVRSRKETAPQGAIDYLKEHPELKDQFKEKYGYIPEGI